MKLINAGLTGGLERWKKVTATGAGYTASCPTINAGGVINFNAVLSGAEAQAQFLAYGNVRGPDDITDDGSNEGVNVFSLPSNPYVLDFTKKIRVRFRAQKLSAVGLQGYDAIEFFLAGSGTGGVGLLRYPDNYLVVNLRGGNDATKGLKITLCQEGEVGDNSIEYNAGANEILTSVSHDYDVQVNPSGGVGSIKIFIDGVELSAPSTWNFTGMSGWGVVNAFFMVAGLTNEDDPQNVNVSQLRLQNSDDCF